MTDSRLSRVHAEVLVKTTPDTRLSRIHAEALVDLTPDTRLSRVHAEVLTQHAVDAKLSRLHTEVLWREKPEPPIATWWDGTRRRFARVKGWWDGTTIRPFKDYWIYTTAPFTPTSLSGSVLALDASDVLAGPVTSWLDRSPQANHLVLSSGGAPVASSGYVTCTSSSVLQTSGNVNVTGAAPRHLFMKIRSRWVNGAFMGYGVSGNANLFDLWYYTGAGSLIWHGYGGGNDTVSGAPAMSPDVWHLVELSYDGSVMRMYMDEGAPQVTGLGSLLTVASPFLFGIGHYSPAGDFDMKAFYFYDRVLPDAERTQVLDYLRAK
jgi:hypothetical protein